MTIKNIVIINGKEVEVKDLEDKKELGDRINKKELLKRNYIIEKTA